jgi:hypothetical protein
MQQERALLELVGFLNPQLRQRLIRRHLAGDAARVLAAGTVVGTPAWLNRSAHNVASARFGAVVRRFIR